MTAIRLFVALAAALVVAGCSDPSPAPASSCPELSADCPDAMIPSYSRDVQPLIAKYCFACHGEGGVEQSVFDYTTYQGVYLHRAAIQYQVISCQMPQADAGAQPTAAERQTLVSWVACNAPQN